MKRILHKNYRYLRESLILRTLFCTLLLTMVYVTTASADDRTSTTRGGSGTLVSNEFTESESAFANPMKGLRSVGPEFEFGRLERMYIPWDDIESSSSDGVEKIRQYSDENFNEVYEMGAQVIPTVYLCWPRSAQNSSGTYIYDGKKYCECHWPSDMTPLDYTSDQFKERVVKLIQKMGEAWDNDPRVAYINMGIIGYWGEQHDPVPTQEIQDLMSEAFNKAFINKKIMVREPYLFTKGKFGVSWDSYAHADQTTEIDKILKLGDRWKTAVMGGECAYDWGNHSVQPGEDPDNSLSDPTHLNYIKDVVRTIHTNHLGWISSYNSSNADAVAGAAELQKTLGYRFVITKAEFTGDVQSDHILHINLSVKNTGSSPLYEKYPLQYFILKKDMRVLRAYTSVHADCTDWMPGDNWNKTTQRYETAPEEYTISDDINVSNISDGDSYVLAVALIDPSTEKPAARFASDYYVKGGLTVLGRIGIRKTCKDHSVTGIEKWRFVTLRKDNLSKDTLVTAFQSDAEADPQAFPYAVDVNAMLNNAAGWGSIILPFDANKSEVYADTVYAYTGDTQNADGTYTLHFKQVDELKAHTPYLVKCSAPKNPVLKYRMITPSNDLVTSGTAFSLVGTYKKLHSGTITTNDLIVSNNPTNHVNDIVRATDGVTLDAFHAYIKSNIPGATVSQFDFEGDIVAGIATVNVQSKKTDKVYNLNGQRVNKAHHGIYIINGKKVSVK